jgi:hypothetical protein
MNKCLASRSVRTKAAAAAMVALAATIGVLTGCTEPANCSVTYRGGCVAAPLPTPAPAPVVAAPPPVLTPVPPPAAPAVPYGDPASFAATDDRQCRSYGLTFGTHDYAECRIRLSAQHRGLDPNTGAK